MKDVAHTALPNIPAALLDEMMVQFAFNEDMQLTNLGTKNDIEDTHRCKELSE